MKGAGSWDSKQHSKRKSRRTFFGIILTILLFISTISSDLELAVEKLRLSDAYTMPCNKSYYASLKTDHDRQMYQKIFTVLKQSASGQPSFFETGMDLLSDRAKFSRICHMVLFDHPEYSPFWSSCRVTVRNDSSMCIQPSSDSSKMVPDSVYLSILPNLKGRDDFETARNIFMYLADTCVYDEERGRYCNDDYGMMVEHKACCQGASFAYKRFLDLAGIPCVVITCTTYMGEYHMVPLVHLFGRWYACDISCALGKDPDIYFCMSSEDASRIIYQIKYLPK